MAQRARLRGHAADGRAPDRHAAFLVGSGIAPDMAAQTREAVDARAHILTPERDEALLREAGFPDVGLFYAAFAVRGRVATAEAFRVGWRRGRWKCRNPDCGGSGRRGTC